MRDAIVTSSVWKPDFKKTLETYPEFETVFLDFAVPECDACHLGGRMSTITGRVSGKPYDRLTFEVSLNLVFRCPPLLKSNHVQPLDDESSEEEEDDEDEDEDESRPKKEFNLGRFCARRTRVFHNFTHWEVRDCLEHVCSNSFSAVRTVPISTSRSRRPSQPRLQEARLHPCRLRWWYESSGRPY